jgi:hypothetical protein
MTRDEKMELIEKYAPIFWMHEDDAFLPEDCAVTENLAKVGTSPKDMKPFKLDDLGKLKDSGKYYLDIPEVDFNNFGVNSNYAGTELGPRAVSAYLREKFSNNKFLYPNARPSLPKYHARVSEIRIIDKGDPNSGIMRSADAGIFGDYQVIQYYFFYLFNDAWNQHVSDWDSTLELFIKKDGSRAYAISYMHYISWMVSLSGKPQKLKPWIADWKETEVNKQMGWSFQYAMHPYVCVANGAHGGYPTPGFSVHGPDVFKLKILGQTDCRQIGKLCIFPKYEPVNENNLINTLKDAGLITNNKPKFIPWEEPILLENQPWLKYKGLWGTKSSYEGWSGATGPSQKACWRMDQRRFKRAFLKAIKGDYSGTWLLNIHVNWHGWR